MSAPKIAIIGAGPAGCMLARLLHLAGIPAAVFEGEASPNYRSQGGTLDLHTDTGLAAMKDAGLFDAFLAKARYDGEYLLMADRDLKPLFVKGETQTKEDQFGGQRPEIDRADLRQILTESLPEGTVRWDHHLKAVAADGTLQFEKQGAIGGFDLVVGADGAWSKVRSFLSDQKPIYSRVALHELRIEDPERNAPELHRLVHGGSVFAHDEGKKMSVQQLGDGGLHVNVCQRHDDEHWADKAQCGYDSTNLEETKAALLGRADLYRDWHPQMKEAIARAEGICRTRNLYMLPVGFRWAHRPGFTLVGDAAHLMTPFAGEGVNVALDDVRKLAAGIVASLGKAGGQGGALDKEALDKAVKEYELEMWPRSERVTRLTEQLMQLWFFTPGAPHSVIATATALHARFHAPALVQPLATAFVHSLFFVKRLSGGYVSL